MIYTIYIIVVTTTTLYYLAKTQLRIHNETTNSLLCGNYIRQISKIILQNDTSSATDIIATTRCQQRALIEAIYIIINHSYGINPATIAQIAKQNNIKEFILKQISHTTPQKRGLLWLQLTTIAPSQQYIKQLQKELNHKDFHLRSCALIARLNIAPNESIKTLTELDFKLRPYDISRIIALVQRGVLPLALEPLLQSNNYNLKILALTIIRVFSLEISIRHIFPIIHKETDIALVHEAIYTLASLRHSLNSPYLRQRLLSMSKPQRRALCRYLSTEGYSINAMQWLFPYNEREYAEQLITSYKRQLIHSTTPL